MPAFASEGMRVSVAIEGIEGEELDNVKVHLGYSDFTGNQQREISIRRWFKNGPKRIQKSLQALGYYSVDVESDYTKENDEIIIIFDVELNQPVIIKSVDAKITGEGQDNPSFIEVKNRFVELKGKKLRHDQYEALKGQIANIAIEQGYFDSQFIEKKIDVFPDKNIANISINFDSGRRYKFGEVIFDKSRLSEDFLRKFIPFGYGAYYDAQQVIKLRSKLLSSQYFNSVSVIRGDKPKDSLLWPIVVKYELKLRNKYDFGVGYGTDIGGRVSFGFKDRLVNSLGHHYSFFTELAQKQQTAGFEYVYPSKDPLRDMYKFNFSYEKEDVDFAKTSSFSIGAERVSIKENDWTRTFFIRYLQEKSFIAEQTVNASLLLPGINWMQSYSNNFKYPTKGWMASINVMGGIENVGSDFSLVHSRAKLKYIKSILPGFRLLLRTELGGMHIDDSDYLNLPLSLRFYAGGDNSVRGYDYKTLSPEENGYKVGGKYLVTGSAEVDYKVAEDWAVAAFVDCGGAINKFTDDLESGVGLGVRWFSPVGPVRLDLAFPQDKQADDLRVHISVGPDL